MFDYVIVGAGSAGCVLANRLTEQQNVRVLLLEAGGSDAHPLIHVPLGMGKMHERGMFDWGYHSVPEPTLAGRRIEAMRGKVLGGSSSINVMAYTRGHRGDYDRWARTGAQGWSFQEVLPYFKRSETWEGGETVFRGGAGPLKVQFSRTSDPLFEAWRQAAIGMGLPITDDFNGEQQVGFGRGQATIGAGRRSSAATAYLKPILSRPNLRVVTKAHVRRVLFKDRRAIGVEYERGGQTVTAEAAREVILSAGVFNTPQILMLSGIGPKDHLASLGIDTLVDLPVGKNLQDHIACIIYFTRPRPGPFRDLMRFDRVALAMIQAYLFGVGPATYLPGGLFAFLKTKPDIETPDIEFIFRGAPRNAHIWFPGVKPPYLDGYGIRPTLLHPKSRGEVLLRSSEPKDPVRISLNCLSDPDDMRVLMNGFNIAYKLALRPEMAPFRGDQVSPSEDLSTQQGLEEWVRSTALTAHHPSCTCPMGTGPAAVVDPELHVCGVESLRVVDASVMPDLVSAHINACVLMIAEKASDMIAGKAPLQSVESAVLAEHG